MADRPRVLLADPDPHSVQALEPALQHLTELTIVDSSELAVQAMNDGGPFDAFIVDIDVGSHGGLWLLEHAAKTMPGSHRVLMSGARPDDFPGLRDRGVAHDIVRKPVLVDQLVAVILNAPNTSAPTQG